MANSENFDGYSLYLNKAGTYSAEVHFESSEPEIKITEEYNWIPVTKAVICGYLRGEIKTVCVPKTVKEFINDDNLYQDNLPYFVKISSDNPWLCADDKAVFSKDKTLLYAFTARKDESYTVPDSVKIIYDNAFYAAYALKKLTMPDSLEEIGEMAFYFCGVRDWKFPKNLKRIGSWALKSVRMNSVILPENIEDMADDAFGDAQSLSPVYLPNYFNKPELDLPNYRFAPEYIVDENSVTLTQIDGVIYTKDMKALLAITQKAPSIITVPDGVEIIAVQASDFNRNIREIFLPSSVHTILKKAFFNSDLEKINLENVKFIGEQAFDHCSKLSETGNIGAEIIGRNGFNSCKSLEKINLTNIKEIGICAFEGLSDNSEMIISEGLEAIHSSNSLKSSFKRIRIPRSASMLDNCIPRYAKEVELYDVENSVIYKKDPRINDFWKGCLVKALSPDTDEVKYAIKIFEAEETDEVNNSREYINSLFGGEQFFDLVKYDEYFRSVFNRKNLLSKYEAAYYRMKYFVESTDYAREMYMTYLEVCGADVIRHMLNKPDITAEEVMNFPYLYAVEEEDLIEIIKRSVNRGLTEITVALMNYKNERFPNSEPKEDDL